MPSRGWRPPRGWRRRRARPAWSPAVTAVHVPFPDLGAADLVAWRVGMAQLAPFVERLPPDARTQLVADAVARLGADHPPLVRSILVMVART